MGVDFLCRQFTELSESQVEFIEPLLLKHPQPLAGYTMGTLLSWNGVYCYKFGFLSKNTLLIACCTDNTGQCYLLQPLGNFCEECEKRLIGAIEKLPYPIKIYGVTTPFIKEHPNFVKYFNIEEDRSTANYIYNTEDLVELKGRKFQKKRNLLNGAHNSYKWTVENLSPEHLEECLYVIQQVRIENGDEFSSTLENENKAVRYALENFAKLANEGLVIKIDGKIVAFSVYEKLLNNPLTAVIHFEKALRAWKGLYQVINQETAQVLQKKGYVKINREEDMGDEGLRQAKLSYNPVELVDAWLLTFKQNEQVI